MCANDMCHFSNKIDMKITVAVAGHCETAYDMHCQDTSSRCTQHSQTLSPCAVLVCCDIHIASFVLGRH